MPKPGRDRVELSIHGGEINRLDGLIPSHSDDREAKIEQVRDAIDSGTYNVNAERIADKIMREDPD